MTMGDFGKTSLLVALVLAIVVCTLHQAKATAKATAEAVTVKPTLLRPQKPLTTTLRF
jgi:cytochrome c biogenesis protein ResB